MTKTVLGVFLDRSEAEHAVDELEAIGFDKDKVSVIMRDRDRALSTDEDRGSNVAGGAATGATTGGVLGGLAGLLVGVGAITVPGIGALLIGGPIAAALGLTGAAATTLTGAVTGALTGGVVGALIGLGIPEEETKTYEEAIRNGGILIAVPTEMEDADTVKSVFEEHGADQIRITEKPATREERTISDREPAYFEEIPRSKK